MFGFEFGHMILLAAIALIAIGPKQLPEVARTLGRMLNEFKRATGDFQRTLTNMDGETTQAFHDVRKSLNESLAPTAAAITSFTKANGPNIITTAIEAPKEPDAQQAFHMGPIINTPADETTPAALDEANQLSFNFDASSKSEI